MKSIPEMTPDELKQNALAGLTAAEKLTMRLFDLTTDQGDTQAARHALGNIRAAIEILEEWYGFEPEE
jgi:hypothetical protein